MEKEEKDLKGHNRWNLYCGAYAEHKFMIGEKKKFEVEDGETNPKNKNEKWCDACEQYVPICQQCGLSICDCQCQGAE